MSKDKRVMFRMTEHDYAVLSEMVRKMDVTMSELVRDAVKLYAEETGYDVKSENVRQTGEGPVS